MKKLFGVLLAVMMISGCTSGSSTGCTIEKTVVDMAAPAIATALQCSNPDKIQADLEGLIGKVGFCKPASSKPKLSAPICDMFASVVMGGLSNTIPASWGCTAANASALLKGVLSSACQKI